MRRKPTSTSNASAKKLRDLSPRSAKRATRGGGEVAVETLTIAHEGFLPPRAPKTRAIKGGGKVQRVWVALPCEREP
jgi:hypothetical protein